MSGILSCEHTATADKRAKYDTVAKVLAMAQRNGMQRIGFTGQEQFVD